MNDGNTALDTTRTDSERDVPDALMMGFSSSRADVGVATNDKRFDIGLLSLPLVQAAAEADEFEADFMSLALFIGLDSGKFTEGERNRIIIELERAGAETGLQLQVLIPQDRPGRIAGSLKGDEKKRRAKQDIMDRFLEAMERYDAQYRKAMDMLLAMIGAIDDRIAALDAAIAAHKNASIENDFNSSSEADEHLRQLEAERAELERIKEEELEEARRALTSENRVPSFDELGALYESVTDTMSRYIGPDHTPSRSSTGRRSSTDEDEDETESPLPPQP
jgi:hypothetical protein